MMAKSVDFGTQLAMPQASREQLLLTRLAIAAIVIGIVAMELVAVGAFLGA
jgi:hypothetical protein